MAEAMRSRNAAAATTATPLKNAATTTTTTAAADIEASNSQCGLAATRTRKMEHLFGNSSNIATTIPLF